MENLLHARAQRREMSSLLGQLAAESGAMTAAPRVAGTDDINGSGDVMDLMETVIASRRNHSAKSLVEPGPDAVQVRQLFAMAAAAPDHGAIQPWRFIVIPAEKRSVLAEGFAAALVERDPGATVAQIEDARAKAYRSPFLAVAVARLGDAEPNIPVPERLISLGAAIQNMLLGANALGFGSGLTSGKAMSSNAMRKLLRLEADESALCCINIGTASRAPKPRSKSRAGIDDFVTSL